MKKFFAIVALFAVSLSAGAVNLYGGTVQAGSAGAAASAVGGGSVAAIAGIAGTSAQAQSLQAGGAFGAVSPSGVVVGQGGVASNTGSSMSGALGLAGAGSQYQAGSANISEAVGNFGTVGLSF